MTDNFLGGFKEKTTKWEHSIVGTKGEFWSSAGQIEYIMTSARLSLEENEASEKLTRQLYPVRELLDFSKMDFDQLLQRDLDDHRVATELIPYLLENSHKGLSFFPPIVAALLPFRKTTPKPSFEDEIATGVEEEDGVHWKGVQSEKAYKYQKLVTPSGGDAPFPVSKLSWNEGGARLVVLDGQHRAMAMLAIARTITDSWKDNGEKYKYFYEKRVKKIIDDLGGNDWLEKNISKIEFPVCVIKFNGGTKIVDQHDSARKLFVDVNQTARRPSESRIILLSDNDLLNIFTRKTLNQIRSENCSFPIYGIEYDYPGSSSGKTQSSKPIKWSSIINIEMLKAAVLRTVFGPSKFVDKVNVKVSGKPNWSDKNKFMRESLGLNNWLERSVEFEGQVFERNKIKRDYFPKNKLDDFVEKYQESWGEAIIVTLSDFLPFKAHSSALNKLLSDWSTIEVHASLAKEAISQGQGMYWTLKDSFDHWKENGSKGSDDTSRAWEAIGYKKKDFEALLSHEFLGGVSEAKIKDTKSFFEIFNTYASFVGLFLTFSTLAKKHKIQGKDIPNFISSIIDCLNASMLANNGKLKTFLLRDIEEPINKIKGMDSPDSVYFRYFWLELLSKSSANFVDYPLIDFSIVKSLTSDSRKYYLSYLELQQINLLKNDIPTKIWKEKEEEYKKDAFDKSSDKLKLSLKKWFGINKSEFDLWLENSYSATEEHSNNDLSTGDS